MKRAILQPADLTGAALAELKHWLGITSNVEDTLLVGLLTASLEVCESFTAQVPLEAVCEEIAELWNDWSAIEAKPVRAITAVDLVLADGSKTTLSADLFEIDITPDGTGRVRVTTPVEAAAVAISFVAGLASQWNALPDAIRHGIIRLAAFHYRDRDVEKASAPPASVSALWRPWRRLRLG